MFFLRIIVDGLLDRRAEVIECHVTNQVSPRDAVLAHLVLSTTLQRSAKWHQYSPEKRWY